MIVRLEMLFDESAELHDEYLLKLVLTGFKMDTNNGRVNKDDATQNSRGDVLGKHESDAKGKAEHKSDGVDDKGDAVLHSDYSSQTRRYNLIAIIGVLYELCC